MTAATAFSRIETKPSAIGEDMVVFSAGKMPAGLRSRPADWLEETKQQLLGLATLPDNWDSYGAQPVSHDAILRTSEIVAHLALLFGLDAPAITATPEGDVGLCWDHGDWSLEASIDSTGLINYVFLRAQPVEEHEARTRDIRELASRLVGLQDEP